MKTKILAICFALVTMVGFSQITKSSKVEFLGVDFTEVNVLGSVESTEDFINAFVEINKLMISESNKYDVAKYLGVEVTYTNIEDAISLAEGMGDSDFINARSRDFSAEKAISRYPISKGNKLLIIAKELNKTTKGAEYLVVEFDGTTKEILSQASITGQAAGFGLRNYWAGSIYDALKSYKKKNK